MTEPKHTQGGWGRNIPPVAKYPIIYAGRNTHIARVITDGIPPEEAEANADLMSAAPDLLAALQSMLLRWGDYLQFARMAGEHPDGEYLEQARQYGIAARFAVARAVRDREPVA